MPDPNRELKNRSIEAIYVGRETLQKGGNTLDKVCKHFQMSVTCVHMK